MRRVFFLLLLAGFLAAQDDEPCGCDDACGCDHGFETDEDFFEEGTSSVVVDPFDKLEEEVEQPNRPEAVKVGVWPAPELTPEAQKALDRMLEARAAAPEDAAPRYRLAEFYVLHKWWPHAEAEYHKCVELDPESVRPWQGLLQVYLQVPEIDDEFADLLAQLRNQGIVIEEPEGARQVDWLPSKRERDRRIGHAYRGFLERRPDDVARRRLYMQHLRRLGDHAALADQAREILKRLPEDADTRFELAEAVRRIGVRREARRLAAEAEERRGDLEESPDEAPPLPNAEKTPEFAEAMALLEENLRVAPHHAPSALRLARMLCAKDPARAGDRARELQERGRFHLFVKSELGEVAIREDTLRMAQRLGGKQLAVTLWEDALRPDSISPWERPGRHYTPFVSDIQFQNSLPRDRMAACALLARRGDREAAVMLLSFLWHLQGPEVYREEYPDEMDALRQMETAAADAVVALGTVAASGLLRLIGVEEARGQIGRAACREGG